MIDVDPGIFNLLGSIPFGGMKFDIVRLPLARFISHGLVGRLDLIEAATFVILGSPWGRVENLDLIALLEITAGIAICLTLLAVVVGHKLDMKPSITKGFFGNQIAPAGDHRCARPSPGERSLVRFSNPVL